MRYFFDTEFIENGREHFPELISIGIVAEDGREFYAERADIPWDLANDWVLANVKPHLRLGGVFLCDIRDAVLAFVGADRPEFWAYYADYDWVILCSLFGRMIDLPKGWPMWCRDLKQLAKDRGDPDLRTLVPEPADEHHALADARWVRDVYVALTETLGGQG